MMLKSHLRSSDQPKTKINVVYGDVKGGKLEAAAQALRAIMLLETVAERVADTYAWPAPFAIEMQSCGYPNARWDLPTHKLTVCYELAPEFADLYRAYGDVRADGSATADTSKRKTVGASAFKSNRQQSHHKRKLHL